MSESLEAMEQQQLYLGLLEKRISQLLIDTAGHKVTSSLVVFGEC